ncbi:GTPase Era [Koleobacter methoxysyntrophicus]|jgi:GTP-binding protein Era|uniref:GTPase Era n=1 Tax=Koleobacter methoxysyntrophicus TaxID=2751313 RepID=A0A8A0RRS5_9FIRM|nr:GTPase Era [Koleobacter methoxysyntrophicus]MDI3540720.1 GTPase [Thermosediminibacterales bacterium]MDK2901177.1 GTPase [Thermosediminibacterales bacterium]NPV42924.1 GTPase Era [Bacillota bacterium]QSQ10208.1 GTPase Era [Koleobacter methoxysyntrophicus]
MEKVFRSGFVSIIGRPNVGKSTLLNTFLKQKVVIMSDKPQTTRNAIRGVLTGKDFQIVFIDTPGIHKPKHRLGEYMVNTAIRTLEEVDAILFMTDSKDIGPGDDYILGILKKIKTPVILVLNKIDLLSREEIDGIIKKYRADMDFYDIIPISALHQANLDNLLDTLKGIMPEGPKYYPDDIVTDQPERFIITELVREKILHLLEQEVPHGIAVDVEGIEERKEKELIYIRVTIYCEKESHKGIIIGKNGRMLKEIGRLARLDIENLLGAKVFLDLWVKVKRDWRNKQDFLRNLGYS